MKRCFCLAGVGFALAVFVSVRAEQLRVEEESVELTPYNVVSYLENYADGNSFSALRTNAPLLEIPLSTSIVTTGLMRDQGLTDVNAAVRNISGAQHVQGGAEFQNYYFTRGMPNFYYRDGVRMELAGGNITANVAGLETIEVLKGPSSILYGVGTPGGIVNFLSKRPTFRAHQRWEVAAGSDDHYRADVDAGGLLGARAAYRVVATVDDAGSYRDGVESTTRYFAPAATVNLSPDTQLFVLVDYADQKATPDMGIATRPDGRIAAWANDGTNFARSFNTVTPRTAGVEFSSVRYFAELSAKLRPKHDLRLMVTHMRFDHDRSDMALNMLDSAASGVPGMLGPDQLLRTWASKFGRRDVSVVRLENILQLSQHVGSAEWEHQVLVSLDYGKTDTDMTSSIKDHEILDLNTRAAMPVWQYFALFGLGTTRDGQLIFDDSTDQTVSRNLAASIQDNVKLSESWRVLWGLRYEKNKAELDSARTNFLLGAMPAPASSHVVSSATKGRLLPRVGVLFKPQPQLALFGNYLTSFIPAGATQTGRDGLIDPETGDQLEVGLKYEAVPGRLFATASVFQIRRRNIATYYQDNTTLLSYWKATDEEKSSGVELEVTGAVGRGFDVVGHLGYLDNESTGTDLAAKRGRMRHALSKVTASLWGTYAVQSDRLKGLRVGFGVFHQGKQYLEDYNTVEIAGRTLCDAMVGYGRGRWSAQLNVRNIFDRHHYLPAGNGYNDPGYSSATYNTAVQAVIPGPGTEWQVKIAYAF